MYARAADSFTMRYDRRYDGERVLAENRNQAMLGTVHRYAQGFLYFSKVEAFFAPLDQEGRYRPSADAGFATHGGVPVFQVSGERVSDIATGDNIVSALASLRIDATNT